VDNQQRDQSVVEKIKQMTTLPIKSFSKKEQKEIEKDVRPLILDLRMGMLDVDQTTKELIHQVSPCDMPGVVIETSVQSGSGIRPSELIEIFRSHGLEAQRPIKISASLRA
jgi:septum formation inhibitor MinC